MHRPSHLPRPGRIPLALLAAATLLVVTLAAGSIIVQRGAGDDGVELGSQPAGPVVGGDLAEGASVHEPSAGELPLGDEGVAAEAVGGQLREVESLQSQVGRSGRASAGEVAGGAADAAPAMDASAPGLAQRSPAELGLKVIQQAELTIELAPGELDAAIEEVATRAAASGGYVATTDLVAGTLGRATVTVRVPARRLAGTTAALGELGEVARRSISGDDVTAEYVDTEGRLRHSRAVERRLLALLDQAEGVRDILTVQDRLDRIQQQLEVDQGRLNQLDRLTRMSTITVSLREVDPDAAPAGEEDPAPSLGLADALREAGAALMARVNAGIVWLGGALPILLLMAGGLLLGRRAWGRPAAGRQARPADRQRGVDPQPGESVEEADAGERGRE